MDDSPVSLTSTRKSGRLYAATRKFAWTVFSVPNVIVPFFARLELPPPIFWCFGLRPIALEYRAQGVIPQSAVLRQCHRPVRAAPRPQFDHPLVDAAVLTVANREQDRGAGREQMHAGGCVLTKNRLEVHFLAEPVHATIGEHRSAKHRLGLVQVRARAEVPRTDAFVPVATRVGDITVFLSGDDEGEFPRIIGIT